MKSEKWIQIPVAPKYEMNACGDVRNIKTGRIMKPKIPKLSINTRQYSLRVGTGCGTKTKSFSQSSLLWLTHGIIPRSKDGVRLFVPVIVSRGNERYYFDSCRQAAQFIARREKKHAVGYIVHSLCKRPKEIDGWRINYQR